MEFLRPLEQVFLWQDIFREKTSGSKVFISTIFFLSILTGLIVCLLVYSFWSILVVKILPEVKEIKFNQLFIILFSILIYGCQLYVSEILTLTKKALTFGLYITSQGIVGSITNIILITYFDFKVDTLFYSLFASNLVSTFFIIFILSKYIRYLPNLFYLRKLLSEYKIIIANIFENFFILLKEI